jgi:hypothetical protein
VRSRGHDWRAGVEGPGCRRPDDVRARSRGPAPPRPARVSLRVDYDERAIDQAAAFLDDPPGIRAVLNAIDRLAHDPARLGRFPTGRLTCGGCEWACTGSCMRLPTKQWRSATSPAAPEIDRKEASGPDRLMTRVPAPASRVDLHPATRRSQPTTDSGRDECVRPGSSVANDRL